MEVDKKTVEQVTSAVGRQAVAAGMGAAAGAVLGHALKPDSVHRGLPIAAQVGSAMGAAAATGAGVSGSVAAGTAVLTAKAAALAAGTAAVATAAAPILVAGAVGFGAFWGICKLVDAIEKELS